MTELSKKCVLVTGANGFMGCNLCAFLKAKGYFVRGAVRKNLCDVSGADEYIQAGDLNELTDWMSALHGVDFVVHLAGRAHVMDEQESDPVSLYHRVNVLGTKGLAEQAAQSGVKRFIFVSSVKVNGEGSRGCFVGLRPPRNERCGFVMTGKETLRAYSEDDIPDPQDAYGTSKREAEDSLACIAAKSGLQTVILRLPLVYGVGVKANFKNLMKIAGVGLPLPLKGINNQRSFLYLGNLMDAVITCITHPLAVGETFLVSDGQDVSTPDLIKTIASAMNKKAVLFSLHPGVLKALCRIVGKAEELEKLTGSLLVDSSKIRNLIGWKPPFTLEEGIKETVKYYK